MRDGLRQLHLHDIQVAWPNIIDRSVTLCFTRCFIIADSRRLVPSRARLCGVLAPTTWVKLRSRIVIVSTLAWSDIRWKSYPGRKVPS